jgi:hypothetical protein
MMQIQRALAGGVVASITLPPSPSLAKTQMDQRDVLTPFIRTAGSARLLRNVTAVFLAFGLLAAAQMVWIIAVDLHARHFWPHTSGELTAISEQSSAGVARASRRTRYWIQFDVRFVVPAEQCRTGRADGSERSLGACIGTVRTRSTQSAYTAGGWMRETFHQRAVEVLYDPAGSEIKIAGEPIWLRYQWDTIGVLTVWLVVFGGGFAVSQRRLHERENES